MGKKKSGLQKFGKLLVMGAAIVHLIFVYIHNNALLLLEDQICGFVMFLFVLLGLTALFEVTQIKTELRKEKILSALLCLATIVMGAVLVGIYREGIAVQATIDVAVVNKAILFSYVLMSVFAVGGVMLLIDGFRTEKGYVAS